MASSVDAALKHTHAKFEKIHENSVYWPHLTHGKVYAGLVARIKDPDGIWQSKTNLCGIAVFWNTLAKDDPYLFAFYATEMYRCGAAYLGYGKKAKLISTSKKVRSCDPPPAMAHVDWLVLASLRDGLSSQIEYSWGVGVPFLKDIPLLGVPFTPHYIELMSGVTYPRDVEAAFRDVGFKTANFADHNNPAGASDLGRPNSYLANDWEVLILVRPAILGTGAQPGGPMLHWVRLTRKFQVAANAFSNGDSGVNCRVWDPQLHMSYEVPGENKSIRLKEFGESYYGFIAAKK